MKATENFIPNIMCAAAKHYMKPGKKVVSQFIKITISRRANNYGTNLLTILLVWHGCHDFVKEGDGNRILLY